MLKSVSMTKSISKERGGVQSRRELREMTSGASLDYLKERFIQVREINCLDLAGSHRSLFASTIYLGKIHQIYLDLKILVNI